jgi:chemotaxis signal transduction protein
LQPFVRGVFPSDEGDYAVFDIEKLLSDADFMEAGVALTNLG